MTDNSFNYVIENLALNGYNIYNNLSRYFKNIIILRNSNLRFNIKVSPNYKINKNDVVFWTSEKFQDYINKCKFKPCKIIFPIDNKYEFSKFIEEKFNEIPIPYFKCKNQIVEKDKQYVIKTKKSYTKNRLRGKLFIYKNIPHHFSNNYFIQKYIKTGKNNISVCGYFEHNNNKNNVLLLTKKIPNTIIMTFWHYFLIKYSPIKLSNPFIGNSS